jgi:hypothetical protein
MFIPYNDAIDEDLHWRDSHGKNEQKVGRPLFDSYWSDLCRWIFRNGYPGNNAATTTTSTSCHAD